MTDRPTKIRVGAADYEVIWETDDSWMRSANSSAQFDGLKQTIRAYVGDGCPAVIACRFMHELAHALIYMHGLSEKDQMTEEHACDAFGYELADFFRTNPDVFAWYGESLGLIGPKVTEADRLIQKLTDDMEQIARS